jgi:hypothetical protein
VVIRKNQSSLSIYMEQAKGKGSIRAIRTALGILFEDDEVIGRREHIVIGRFKFQNVD